MDILTYEKLNESEYLSAVVKEVLRIDGPVDVSLAYKAYKPVTLCGVDIPEGTVIY